jgi:hypothetical protein
MSPMRCRGRRAWFPSVAWVVCASASLFWLLTSQYEFRLAGTSRSAGTYLFLRAGRVMVTDARIQPAAYTKSWRCGFAPALEMEPLLGFERVGDAVQALGFRYEARDGFLQVHVHVWPVIFVSGMMILVKAVQRWRRRSSGRCVWCGYDLRPTLDRCPECGESTRLAPARDITT